ncbi:hypothetical protein L2E82_53693 [Cichorium intybus]|nr:hypothetical protein L2E82_53693 [Cichorium intybus]
MLGLRASRAQYKRMEWNLPLKKDICLTQAFRSHFLLKEDRKKLKVEKEGSDVYEQNEPQIEKADQGEIPLSIGVLRWERKCQTTPSIRALGSHQPVIPGRTFDPLSESPFHTGLPDHYGRLSSLFDQSVSQSGRLIPLRSRAES